MGLITFLQFPCYLGVFVTSENWQSTDAAIDNQFWNLFTPLRVFKTLFTWPKLQSCEHEP